MADIGRNIYVLQAKRELSSPPPRKLNFKLAFLSFIFFVFASVFAPAPAAYAADGGLEQDSDNYYLIGSAADLAAFRDGVNDGTYAYSSARLTRDITLTEENWTPIGNGSYQFTGEFDGGGHTISGLVITSSDQYVGLFGYVGSDGAVQNLTLKEPNLTASNSSARVGAIAGRNDGTIKNCRVSGGSVTDGYYTGGVVGYNYSGTVSNCTNSGDVTSGSYRTYNAGTGGVVGYNGNSSIVSNCANSGDVTDRINSSYSSAGGVVGYNGNSTVSNCTNSGDVTKSTSNSSCYIGGVVGENIGGTVSNCANSGSVTATNSSNHIGGVVGDNSTSSSGPGSVSNCGFLEDSAAKGIGQQIGSSTNTNVVSFSSEEMAKIAVTLSASIAENAIDADGGETTIRLLTFPGEEVANVITAKGLSESDISCTAADSNLVTVTNNGSGTFKVAAKANGDVGETEITLSAKLYKYNFSSSGSGYDDSDSDALDYEITFNLMTVVKVEEITLSDSSLKMTAGDSHPLTVVSYEPDDTTQTEVTWKSSDESVATVDDGVVTAIAAGNTTITAASADNPSVYATCTVTVTDTSTEQDEDDSTETDEPDSAETDEAESAETDEAESETKSGTSGGSSGGGGCNAGTGALALLALIPLALRRKR